MAKEDISNRTVLVLALLVVLVVASSTWMVLNKLNSITPDSPSGQVVQTQSMQKSPETTLNGKVSISVLPSKESE